MKTSAKDPILRFYHLLLILLALGFLYIIWPYISGIVFLLVFAFLFTTILLPIVDWLEGRMKSRALAVMSTVVTLLAVISLFLFSFIVQLSQEARTIALDLDQEQLVQGLQQLREAVVDASPTFVQGFIQEYMGGGTDGGFGAAEISRYVNTVIEKLSQLTGAIGSFLFFAIMLLLFTIIILYEYHNFKRTLVKFIPNKYLELGIRLVRNIEKQVSSYLHGQLLAASSVAAMSVIGLFLLNLLVDANLSLIVFIGVIAGLANLIPLVGPFVGMVPAVLIAIMNHLGTDGGPAGHLLVVIISIVVMFFIVQQIDNNLVTPKLVGQSVGMHPIVVIMALLIGANLMGPLGMLVAVPAAGTIKVITSEIMWAVRNAHLL
ncbi:MAG: AI-2E family transporter [Candidatus Neomarinimicrobiota bacterium]